MRGNHHVRFLGEGAVARPLSYPTRPLAVWIVLQYDFDSEIIPRCTTLAPVAEHVNALRPLRCANSAALTYSAPGCAGSSTIAGTSLRVRPTAKLSSSLHSGTFSIQSTSIAQVARIARSVCLLLLNPNQTRAYSEKPLPLRCFIDP